jgi:DNA-binding NarL/FixJ family response regulator
MHMTLPIVGTAVRTAGRTKFPASPTVGAVASCHHERMPRSVLVVDDDAGFRGLATRILTGWGHVVIGEAGSVAEALAQAIKLRPDTVLVDVGLPDGDGFSLTEQLVAMPWAVHVVLISSDSDRTTVQAARRAGADSFLPKDELSSVALRQLIEGW